MLLNGEIINHIRNQIIKSVYELQNSVSVEDAEVVKHYFSEVKTLKIRKNFSLNIQKSIYEKTGYPSNKGGFEKSFLDFADSDSKVERLLKINENHHKFAHMRYIRNDGELSPYFPDFMIKIGDNIYMVETKAQKDVSQENVQQKQRGALNWIKKVNELPPEDRMHATWHYVILDDNTFQLRKAQGATTQDVLEECKLTNTKVEGTLF